MASYRRRIASLTAHLLRLEKDLTCHETRSGRFRQITAAIAHATAKRERLRAQETDRLARASALPVAIDEQRVRERSASVGRTVRPLGRPAFGFSRPVTPPPVGEFVLAAPAPTRMLRDDEIELVPYWRPHRDAPSLIGDYRRKPMATSSLRGVSLR